MRWKRLLSWQWRWWSGLPLLVLQSTPLIHPALCLGLRKPLLRWPRWTRGGGRGPCSGWRLGSGCHTHLSPSAIDLLRISVKVFYSPPLPQKSLVKLSLIGGLRIRSERLTGWQSSGETDLDSTRSRQIQKRRPSESMEEFWVGLEGQTLGFCGDGESMAQSRPKKTPQSPPYQS
jgi:hypothetical protein